MISHHQEFIFRILGFWGLMEGGPCNTFARFKNAFTICRTTSSKNMWERFEWSWDLNSKATEKSRSVVFGLSGRPGPNLHTVTRWLNSRPSVHTDFTYDGLMTVTVELYLSMTGGNPIANLQSKQSFLRVTTVDSLHQGTKCLYFSTCDTIWNMCWSE